MKMKTAVFAPHDDGTGGFAVLWRLARALVRVADQKNCNLRVYFLNSSAARGGQVRLEALVKGTRNPHSATYVAVDNLIWLPKDPHSAAVLGCQIPNMLMKSVRPFWLSWPCTPNWIRPNSRASSREDWIGSSDAENRAGFSWGESGLPRLATARDLTTEWWSSVDLGISMGVPQLHRLARGRGFPSVEVGDWFFSVGLRGCMYESGVPPEIISLADPDLQMIAQDEFKAAEAWLTLYQAPYESYRAHLASSSVRLRVMTGIPWTGDPPPDVTNWPAAEQLRQAIVDDIATIRGAAPKRIAYIVPGTTPVWANILDRLRKRNLGAAGAVAILELNRSDTSLRLLEGGGRNMVGATTAAQGHTSEEAHLAVCRACDFVVTRTAGGVLSAAETQRPSVLVDEPGHWLGRMQREQCWNAGLCVVVSLQELLKDPGAVVQEQANKIGTGSELDRTVTDAANQPIGGELDLAQYLFEAYLE